MKLALAMAGLCILLSGVALGQRPAAPATVMLDNCNVRLVQQGEAKLAAQEAGVLTEITVSEGQQIPAGMLLAKIDDIQPVMQKRAAAAERDAAQAKYENDVEIRHATKAAEVAQQEYLSNVQANQKAPGAIADVDIKKLKFQWEKAVLAIEQSKKEQKLNGFTAQGKQAEVDNADAAIKRREVRSTIEGVVQAIYPHIGEWVKPGDPVLRLMRMDRLRVEGFLNKSQYNPWDVSDQPVVVEAVFAGGRKAQFKGKIVYVDPEVQADGGYKVRAEVDNRKENEQWLLRPGMPDTTMTIQLRPAGAGMQAVDKQKEQLATSN
jgi:macrolide-specific efflux system membrane fusion protein